MKEGLGDILYFLAMIAFFVISAIAKSKKEKKKVVPPSVPAGYPDESSEQSEFPWLDEAFEENEEPLMTEEPVPEPKPVPDFRRASADRMAASNIQMKAPREHKIFIYSEVEGSESDGSYWDEEEFDLKKAMIFSEILKRPDL